MVKKLNQQHKLKGEEKSILSNVILYLSIPHQLEETTKNSVQIVTAKRKMKEPQLRTHHIYSHAIKEKFV